jgi:ABC-type glycerol-3-phosphate transport system substrate-binding protein
LGQQDRKAVRVRLALAFAGLLLLLGLAGCGGAVNGFTGTPAGTFQVTVTATSQSTGQSGSTTVNLVVLD